MPSKLLEGKSILITGGTGSFGQAMTRALLEHKPRRIIIYSRDEWKQWKMQQEFSEHVHTLRFFLGCIRDPARLEQALRGCDIVLHAAALKQVPAAEYNPIEFIKTNVDGTSNVIQAAIAQGVKKLLTISTDKAVNPLNLYGATKLCSEKLTISSNVYAGQNSPSAMSVVRYGNVVGSRGSVLPLWLELMQGGQKKLPITSLEMTRFWITLEQATKLVIECLQDMQGGEIFVPKIQSTSIEDLFNSFGDDVQANMIGIRPGEKLHELLITSEESHQAYTHQDRYIILPPPSQPDHYHRARIYWSRHAKSLEKNFQFTSENATRMKATEIKSLIEKIRSDIISQ